MSSKYMHTIHGRPAFYNPGQQVCYAGAGTKLELMFCESLKELRKQQEASRQWRKKMHFANVGADEITNGYGYLRVVE